MNNKRKLEYSSDNNKKDNYYTTSNLNYSNYNLNTTAGNSNLKNKTFPDSQKNAYYNNEENVPCQRSAAADAV